MAVAEEQDLGSPPGDSRLAIAAVVVGFGFMGSRLLGVLRTTAIAGAFGASPELDAYNVAFRVPDLIFQVLAGATLGSAFIPVFTRVSRREGKDRGWEVASTVLNLVTFATLVLCVVAFVFAPFLVPLLAPGLGMDVGRHAELTEKAVSLTRLMLLSPLFFSMSGMITGILNGRERFLLPALAPMLYNVAIIGGALLLSGPLGVEGLAIGVVAGAGLHLAIQIPGLFRERMQYRLRFNWRDPAAREVGRLMGPRVVGLAAAQVNFLVTVYFGSKVGSNTISNLNYAWLLAGLPLALFGMALSTAVFPRLAGHAADEDLTALTATVSRVLRLIMFLTLPAAVGLAVLRTPATALLLERGAFTSADAAVTAAALGFYCFGIVPQAGIEIHSRGFYALGDTRTPVTLAVVAVGVNLLLSALLWERFEYRGLAFSVSAAAWLEWLLLYGSYKRRTRSLVAGDLASIGRMVVSAGTMAVALLALSDAADADTMTEYALVAIVGAIGGAAIYGVTAMVLGVTEVREASSRLKTRLRKPV